MSGRVMEVAAPASGPDPGRVTSAPPLRVLLVIDQLRVPGGAERMLLQIAARLQERHCVVRIVTFDLDSEAAWLRDPWGMGPTISIVEIPVGKTFSFAGVHAAVRLSRLLRRERFDVVQTFFETSDLWAAPIAWLSGCRCLLSSRRDMGVLRTWKHRAAYPLVDRLFRRVLTVSAEVRGFTLTHSRLPQRRVETVYNGVDLAALDHGAATELPPEVVAALGGSPVIAAVAHVRYIKGLDVLLEAVARCVSVHPDVKLVIAGRVLEPETMAGLQDQTTRLNLSRHVLFTGELTQPSALMKRSCMFVLPSRNEGFSNALLEAMACRLPVIATAVGGNAEAVSDGETGFIVPSEDPVALAERMLLLLGNPELAHRMGRRGRDRVAQHFSMDRMIDRLTAVYAACLEEIA